MRKPATSPKGASVAFFAGCILFLTGTGNLALALEDATAAHTQQAATGQEDAQTAAGKEADTSEQTQDASQHVGKKNSSSQPKKAKAAKQAAKKKTGKHTKKKAQIAKAARKAKADRSKTGSSNSQSSNASPAPQVESPATTTLHHTASKRVPVYVTVCHTAATSHTVSTAKGTKITWTLCTACGKRHSSSFTKKTIDHYEKTVCAACGGIHAAAYDEEVAE